MKKQVARNTCTSDGTVCVTSFWTGLQRNLTSRTVQFTDGSSTEFVTGRGVQEGCSLPGNNNYLICSTSYSSIYPNNNGQADNTPCCAVFTANGVGCARVCLSLNDSCRTLCRLDYMGTWSLTGCTVPAAPSSAVGLTFWIAPCPVSDSVWVTRTCTLYVAPADYPVIPCCRRVLVISKASHSYHGARAPRPTSNPRASHSPAR